MLNATPLLRAYARWRLHQIARQDAVAEQLRLLLRLTAHAAGTRFGTEHGFARLRPGRRFVADFQSAVPLRQYDDFWQTWWQPRFPRLDNVTWPGTMPYFANTSGTSSGITKHIPVSQAMMRANQRAAIDLLVHHAANRPQSRILGGRNFMLGGSTALTKLAPGVAMGDLSGIAAASVPWWARSRYFPSGSLAAITDWEEKTQQLARQSLQEDVRSISGTPSWLLLFFEQLQQVAPGRGVPLAGYYPRLELLAHGGISFAPYRARFVDLLSRGHAETREVYPASEGFIAIADRGPDDGLRLIVDNGLFFELVPIEELGSPGPTRHWLATAEPGVDYAVVVTTCAGLWSYVVGDTVRLTSLRPPRLFITGRTSYGLSAFGEHLTGEEIERAVSEAADAIGANVTDFTVGPVFAGRGHHLFVVEFHEPVRDDQLAHFSRSVDRQLSEANADYAAHRKGDFGMDAPQVIAVRSGAFAAWMKRLGKLGGQNKVPRVITDPDALQRLVASLSTTR